MKLNTLAFVATTGRQIPADNLSTTPSINARSGRELYCKHRPQETLDARPQTRFKGDMNQIGLCHG